jgi:hypothetical protein
MREFGLYVVGQCLEHATFAEMGNPYFHAIAAVQAAHGSEIIIKARIAQEHPLLIFSALPKAPADNDKLLNIEDLLSKGRTASYFELPDLLWATTGYRIPEIERYIEFGKLRNMLQHLSRPSNVELGDRTIEYVFKVIEPMVSDFWGETCFDYVGLMGEETEIYLQESLDKLGIPHSYTRS